MNLFENRKIQLPQSSLHVHLFGISFCNRVSYLCVVVLDGLRTNINLYIIILFNPPFDFLLPSMSVYSLTWRICIYVCSMFKGENNHRLFCRQLNHLKEFLFAEFFLLSFEFLFEQIQIKTFWIVKQRKQKTVHTQYLSDSNSVAMNETKVSKIEKCIRRKNFKLLFAYIECL